MNVAVIGCGSISKNHTEGIAASGAKLVAVCDIKRERAEKLSEKYGGKVYTDFETLLKSESLDAVHICTPHYLHVPMAVRALECGVNVMLEKPPAMTESEFEALYGAAERSGKVITVCFQNRFNTTTNEVADIIESGRYGKLIGAKGIVTWKRCGEYYTESDWRGKLKTEGGGVLINQSIHTLDLLGYLLGTPKSVAATVSNLTHGDEIEVEDTVCAEIDYGKVRGLFFATTSCVDSPSAEITLFFENARVTFDSARITVTGKNVFETKDLKSGTLHGKSCWGSSHMIIINKFYECLEGGPNPCSLDSCKNTVRLMNAIYKNGITRPERESL